MNNFIKLIASVLLLSMAWGLVCTAEEPSKMSEAGFYQVFWDRLDIRDPYGHIQYKTESMARIGEPEGFPQAAYGCAAPREAGGWWVYCWSYPNWSNKNRDPSPMQISRVWTTDGLQFHDEQIVFTDKSQCWLCNANIIYRESDGMLFLFSWARGKPGHAVYVFSSADGLEWKPIASPAFTDHDAFCVYWDSAKERLVDYQTTYQQWDKKYPDNLKDYRRRVLSIRTSKDGVHWDPPDNISYSRPFRDEAELIVPDELDPPEVEFYRVCVFPLHGRVVGLLCKYASLPQIVNPRKGTLHGPGIGSEWFFCRQLANLERPDRDLDATVDVEDWVPRGQPLRMNGKLYWYNGREKIIAGIDEDRIFYATCRANAEFSTPRFKNPKTELFLNAKADQHDSYIMAELRDQDNHVIAGYEKEKCIFTSSDDKHLGLRWAGKTTADVQDKEISVRFYFRNARIYNVN